MAKTILIWLAVFLMIVGGNDLAGAETPVEERLASLQIEEVVMKLRYRPQSPKLLEVQAQIKALLEMPDIRNTHYYDYLVLTLAGFEKERESLGKKLRPGNPALAEADAKIAFVRQVLAGRPSAPTESSSPSTP